MFPTGETWFPLERHASYQRGLIPAGETLFFLPERPDIHPVPLFGGFILSRGRLSPVPFLRSAKLRQIIVTAKIFKEYPHLYEPHTRNATRQRACCNCRDEADMHKASPYSMSENSMNEVETGFFPSPHVSGLLTQKINKKSNEKILQKWISTNPHLYSQQRFFAEFFIFDFSQIFCEAITTFGQFSLCIRIANARNQQKI